MVSFSRRFSHAWLMTVGEEEEQALHLHAAAIFKQILQPLWAQVGEAAPSACRPDGSSHDWGFIEQFQDCTLRRRERQWPIPLPP